MYGTRLLLRVGKNDVCSIPRQWTDVIAPDPELALSRRRAVLRVSDLIELAELVARLRRALPRDTAGRKGNSAADVMTITPPTGLRW